MKNKLNVLLVSLRKCLEQIIAEELEIMDRFYYECTQMDNFIEGGGVHV